MSIKTLQSLILFQLISGSSHAVSTLIKVEELMMQKKLYLSAVVAPRKSEMIMAQWPVVLDSIKVKVGQVVKIGELIATVELDYFKSQLDYLQTQMKFLVDQKKASKISLDFYEKDQKRLDRLAAKDVIPKIEAEKFQITVMENKKSLWDIEASVNRLQRDLDTIHHQIKESNFYAPISGIVSRLVVDPRQFTGALMIEGGTVITQIDEPNRYVARASALDTQMVGVKEGQDALIIFEGSNKEIKGVVSALGVAGDEKTRLFLLEVSFTDPGPQIPSGITAKIELSVGQPKKVATVPWNAVEISKSGAWITSTTGPQRQLASGDNLPLRKRVVLGMRSRYRVEILKGANIGDELLAELW